MREAEIFSATPVDTLQWLFPIAISEKRQGTVLFLKINFPSAASKLLQSVSAGEKWLASLSDIHPSFRLSVHP